MKTQEINSQNIQCRNSMLVPALILSLTVAFMLSGCERTTAGQGAAEKRVAELEKQVAALQEQNRDFRAKARTVNAFGRSPLADFFASPEFWHCTYDSSWSDCSGRCSKNTTAGYKACLEKPEGPERERCVTENMERGANCLKNCPKQFSPISPPDCAGGTGPA